MSIKNTDLLTMPNHLIIHPTRNHRLMGMHQHTRRPEPTINLKLITTNHQNLIHPPLISIQLLPTKENTTRTIKHTILKVPMFMKVVLHHFMAQLDNVLHHIIPINITGRGQVPIKDLIKEDQKPTGTWKGLDLITQRTMGYLLMTQF